MKNLFTLISLYTIFFTGSAPKIYTIAGFSNAYGDGRNSSRAALYEPHGIVTDSRGNLYYTEIYNHTICRMDTNKVVTVIAGKRYQAGYTGDGLRATEALLNSPADITIDNSGNIYFADQGNHCIRRIDKGGIIHTVAGNGIEGFSGDGGGALQATLNSPQDVAFDKQGNLYIADPGSQRIRKVDAQGIITTYAGNGTTGFSGDSSLAIHASLNNPQGIVVTKEGNLAIADCYNNRIRLVNSTTGIITTIAGTGKHPEYCYAGDKSENGLPAISAKIGEPTDVDIDSDGMLYIAESYACNISTIDSAGVFRRTKAYAELVYKLTINKQANQLYFTTTNEDDCWALIARIDQYDLGSEHQKDVLDRFRNIRPKPYSGNKRFATLASVSPKDIACDDDGNLYIAEAVTVKKIDSHGIITTIAGSGYLTGTEDNGDGGSALKAKFRYLTAIVLDKKGNIYVADYSDRRIRKINKKGIVTTIAGNSVQGYTPDGNPAVGNPMYEPYDIGVDDNGTVYYATATTIRKIDERGLLSTIAGGSNKPYYLNKNNVPAKQAVVGFCTGLYIDSKEKSIYYTEYDGSIVRKIDSTGIVNTITRIYDINTFSHGGYSGDGGPAIKAEVNTPCDVTKDQFGNIYICDKDNQRIRRIAPDGIISTIAGNGAYEVGNCDGENYYYGVYGGDGDAATSAALNLGSYGFGYIEKTAITTDKNGNIYIAEIEDGRIRKVAINCKQQITSFFSAAKQYVNGSTSMQYGCNVICNVQPSGSLSTALNSIVVAKVWVQEKPVHTGEERMFVSRYYAISPEANALGATANVTLYYTQAEFDLYNKTVTSSFTKLPVHPNDTAGINNIRIVVANGDGDSTGLPLGYAGLSKILNPSAQNIQWNDSLHSWQITVDANGFGGYFLSTTGNSKKYLAAKKDIASNPSRTDVFPNPAANMVTISCTQDLLNTAYVLTDATGRILLNNKITALMQPLNISTLQSGIYFIKFKNNDVKKIIKY